jgi:homoserine O-acetyltransferase
LGLLKSTHGHDAFLIDMEALNKMVVSFREEWKFFG